MAPTILLFSVVLLLANNAFAANVSLGNRSEGKLVYHQKFENIPKPDVTETGIGTVNIKDGVITAIDIKDLQGDGRSVNLSGGIGENKAKIALIGERGTGFKFIVDVYGKLSKSDDSSKDTSEKQDPKDKDKSDKPDESSKDKSNKPDESSKDKSDKPDESSKDKSDKPDESSKDKSDKPDKSSEDKPDKPNEPSQDKPDEPSKDKTDKSDESSKDKSDKPDEASKDKSDKPSKDPLLITEESSD